MFISVAFQLLNACILAAALTFILYKPVRKFLKKRADEIQSRINQAENDMARASELMAFYEKKLADIEEERLKVLEAAHVQSSEKSRRMLLEAELEMAAQKEHAFAEIKAERERTGEEMRHHIIDVASAMAEKFVARAIDEATRDRLFDETMAALEDTL